MHTISKHTFFKFCQNLDFSRLTRGHGHSSLPAVSESLSPYAKMYYPCSPEFCLPCRLIIYSNCSVVSLLLAVFCLLSLAAFLLITSHAMFIFHSARVAACKDEAPQYQRQHGDGRGVPACFWPSCSFLLSVLVFSLTTFNCLLVRLTVVFLQRCYLLSTFCSLLSALLSALCSLHG
jgi:hypothetical protein